MRIAYVLSTSTQERQVVQHLPVMYPPTNWKIMKPLAMASAKVIFFNTCTSDSALVTMRSRQISITAANMPSLLKRHVRKLDSSNQERVWGTRQRTAFLSSVRPPL